jgi:hypothetical protein
VRHLHPRLRSRTWRAVVSHTRPGSKAGHASGAWVRKAVGSCPYGPIRLLGRAETKGDRAKTDVALHGLTLGKSVAFTD